jgi:hypothetical protein
VRKRGAEGSAAASERIRRDPRDLTRLLVTPVTTP